jgi:hypothetical protein
MSERRTRKDKGIKRKPAETPRESFLDYFAGLCYDDRVRLVADLQIIQRYAPEVPAVQAIALVEAQA